MSSEEEEVVVTRKKKKKSKKKKSKSGSHNFDGKRKPKERAESKRSPFDL